MSTWQAREETKVWQKAVHEKAARLVRLNEAIEQLERTPLRTSDVVMIRLWDEGSVEESRGVPVERAHLLALFKEEERAIMQDMARILRQVTE